MHGIGLPLLDGWDQNLGRFDRLKGDVAGTLMTGLGPFSIDDSIRFQCIFRHQCITFRCRPASSHFAPHNPRKAGR